jgi:DNA-binding response OmpR family regulator
LEGKDILEGKNILVVDDEPDILETLEELLSECNVEKASTFEEAWQLLGTKYFDIAILDIMGVDGFRLLNLANERKVTAVMLTAHALSPGNAVKSYKEGAALYLPKDEMIHIAAHLRDILEAKKEGKDTWWRWLEKLGSFFDTRFGPDWKTDNKKFWEKLTFISRR